MGTTLKFLSENTVRKCTFGKPITIMQSPYKCVAHAVKGAGGRGYVNGPGGAACTRWLKKRVRKEWECEHPELYPLRYVWGMDAAEAHRADRIRETMIEFDHAFPLIERGIGKAEAHEILRASGIKKSEAGIWRRPSGTTRERNGSTQRHKHRQRRKPSRLWLKACGISRPGKNQAG